MHSFEAIFTGLRDFDGQGAEPEYFVNRPLVNRLVFYSLLMYFFIFTILIFVVE